MSMYKIPPLVPEDVNVKPADILYFLPSYHDAVSQNGGTSLCNGVPEDDNHDPVKAVETKQHELIKSLMNLGSTLDNLLKEMGKSGYAAEPTEEKPIEAVPSSTEAPSDKASKADKEAKKAARKAAKAEAKVKVGPDSSLGKKLPAADASNKQWTFTEEKRSNETGQALTACLPQGFVDFEKQKLGDIRITFTSVDKPWIEALSHFSEKRNVVFKEKFSVVAPDCSLCCRISAWKLLGVALGLFSFASNHSIQAAHQHRWLSKMDFVLAGKLSRESAIREASQFLSQFDALSSQFCFGIADIIARSVLLESVDTALPNNVELWVKRLQSVM
ncbi:unnamed protein product [Heligmosomoides polygyrus]|uniref:Thioredoxin_16 domain-containing protein n=1 Tax=Heligmosomoides polygyrus TaxID=6339 RepID=A0A183FIX1_HELPZ|nr:unnamed protein product [Heligmosomoides polygyrus]